MPDKMNRASKSGARSEPDSRTLKRPEAAPETPPESATDFEHVLRRLVSARASDHSER